MRLAGACLASSRTAAARLLAASLLLCAQILGAALAVAPIAPLSSIELCVGNGGPITVTLPGKEEPVGHDHGLCPCCLASPAKSPVPSLPAVPLPGPAVAAEPPSPLAEAGPASPERTLRPPGRAPPSLS